MMTIITLISIMTFRSNCSTKVVGNGKWVSYLGWRLVSGRVTGGEIGKWMSYLNLQKVTGRVTNPEVLKKGK